MARLAYIIRAQSLFGCRTSKQESQQQHPPVKGTVSRPSPDCAAGRLEWPRRLRSGRCLGRGTFGEGYDLSASALLTAHRLAQHRLGIVMVSGGQLILDSPDLGDDGVAHGGLFSRHSYSPDNPDHRGPLGQQGWVELTSVVWGTLLRQSYGFAFSRRLRLTADKLVAVLFLSFVDMFEILPGIVAEFPLDLMPCLTCLLHNRVFHLRPPSTLPACRQSGFDIHRPVLLHILPTHRNEFTEKGSLGNCP